MVIKNVSLTHEKQRTILSARCKIRKIGWDTLYFSISSANKSYVFEDASPFAAALLIPAMKAHENLIIHGSISKQLYDGMQEIMDVLVGWNLGLQHINIAVDSLSEDKQKPNRTGSFFTGGVDSFYTFLKHQKDKKTADRIDSFILVRGFDIKLTDKNLWDLTIDNVAAIAKAEKVKLITVDSNIREVLDPILLWDFRWYSPWDYTHGASLAATGLFIRKAFQKIYIPSTFSFDELIPWGSNPHTDKLWSTEKLSFVHDGADVTRMDKIMNEVAKSPTAHKHLRVCYVNSNGVYNCGECAKCLRTMVSFYVAGVLDKIETFPHSIDLDKVAVGPVRWGDGHIITYGEDLNLKALQERDMDQPLQKAIKQGIDNARSKKATKVEKLKIKVLNVQAKAIYVDYAYFGGHSRTVLSALFNKS